MVKLKKKKSKILRFIALAMRDKNEPKEKKMENWVETHGLRSG